VSGCSGWALPKATHQPVVDRLAELCVAASNDPKVKEVFTTFALEPAREWCARSMASMNKSFVVAAAEVGGGQRSNLDGKIGRWPWLSGSRRFPIAPAAENAGHHRAMVHSELQILVRRHGPTFELGKQKRGRKQCAF
jgi:hypothetical protein